MATVALPAEIQTLLDEKQKAQKRIQQIDVTVAAWHVAVAKELRLSDGEGALARAEEEPPAEAPTKPAPKPRRRQKADGTTKRLPRAAIVEAVQRVGPEASLGAIRERLKHAGHDLSPERLHPPLSTAVQAGDLVRVGRGLYSTPEQEAHDRERGVPSTDPTG